ncbi:MAG: UDP-N-acetylmuramate dehydrogenase [Clostridia bacterium]|nr:MAG: UDP-N-acetylmuramate dehydrogenase [Clostridia bacterium]
MGEPVTKLQARLGDRVRLQEPLSRHTTWCIGGPADVMVFPATADHVALAWEWARASNLPWVVIGNGSNILVADDGFRGMVIKIGHGLRQWRLEGSALIAQAGVPLPLLVRRTAAAGLSGIEFAAGIPATVGGACVMNAGAFGHSMGERVASVKVLGPGQDIRVLSRHEVEFSYRRSSLGEGNLAVVEVTLELIPEAPAVVTGRVNEWRRERARRQPLRYPSAGSVFINPPGYAAGWLLEQAGAKGMGCGGAQVSRQHANFIINRGGATARDVEELMARMQDMVYRRFGIILEAEIRRLGTRPERG